MKDLKTKNINELNDEIDNIMYFLLTHNKNYTKEQYFKINELQDILTEIKER